MIGIKKGFLALGLLAASALQSAHAGMADQLSAKLSELASQSGATQAVAGPRVKRMWNLQGSTVDFVKSEGERLLVAATCDQDCDDVDVEIYDAAGTLIAANRDTGPATTLLIPEHHAGQFSVRFTMEDCVIGQYSSTMNSCYAAAAVFRN